MNFRLIVICMICVFPIAACTSPLSEKEVVSIEKQKFLRAVSTRSSFTPLTIADSKPNHICVIGRAASPRRFVEKNISSAVDKSGFDRLSEDWVEEDNAVIILSFDDRIESFSLSPKQACCLQLTHTCSLAEDVYFEVVKRNGFRNVYLRPKIGRL